MKHKFTTLTIFLVVSSVFSMIYSQEIKSNESQNRPSTQEVSNEDSFKLNYLLSESDLIACFKNGLIPTNLPKRPAFSSDQDFKIAIGLYIQENPHLFVKSEIAKYGYDLIEKKILTEEEIRNNSGKNHGTKTVEEIEEAKKKSN